MRKIGIVNRLLLDKMRQDKAAQLRAYFDNKLPNADWVEGLLEGLSGSRSVDNVLKLIREDPSQTMRHCTTLSVGLYFVKVGMSVEFLDTDTSRNFDIRVSDALAVEVKHLDDISNWSPLSRRILEIPSSYLVNVSTDLELSEKQADRIVAEIRAAVIGHAERAFQLSTANADMHFVKVQDSEKTLPVLSSRTFGIDLPALRRLFSSRIEDAKGQLKGSDLLKFVAIDADRSRFFSDTLEQVFCGTETWHFSKTAFQYLGSSPNHDGILSETDFWNGVDGVMVFHGYDGGARRIGYYRNPSLSESKIPKKLGYPDKCA